MLLFRKSKVLKVLREYHRIFHQEVPEGAIGGEELVALKNIELEQLAIMYDNLKGYDYFVGTSEGADLNVRNFVPDRSRWKPSTTTVVREGNNVCRQVRLYKNHMFLQRNVFINTEVHNTCTTNFVKEGDVCWKNC